MTMSIALRFIPILLEETDKIYEAQIARGADFEKWKYASKSKSYDSNLVPLFVSAFRHANDLAMAMGGKMLPRRRRTYEDETASLCEPLTVWPMQL